MRTDLWAGHPQNDLDYRFDKLPMKDNLRYSRILKRRCKISEIVSRGGLQTQSALIKI